MTSILWAYNKDLSKIGTVEDVDDELAQVLFAGGRASLATDENIAASQQFHPAGVVSGGTVPPKSGTGSGRAAWASYAQDNGLAFDNSSSRDDIIAALAAAGIPTE